MYHQNLAKILIDHGHSVIICSLSLSREVVHDGVAAVPPANLRGLVNDWCDIIVTTPMLLPRVQCGKPMVYIQHNCNREPFDMTHGRVIYCAHHVAAKIKYDCKKSMVFYPPNRYENHKPLAGGDKYVLINCNRNKGGLKLIEYAKQFPNKLFVGVLSAYGNQIQAMLPNLEYRAGNSDLKALLHDCKALLMPSETEGMPTVAMESVSLGIPVYTSDIPAFKEIGFKYVGIEKQIETGEYYKPYISLQSESNLVDFITYL